MTGYERVARTFAGEKMDQIPAGEDFWDDTIRKWTEEDQLKEGETPVEHFDLDMDRIGIISFYVDHKARPVLLEETEDTVLREDGNGAVLRTHKHHASTPEHIDFKVKDRKTWDEFAKPALAVLDESRIPFDEYRQKRKISLARGLHFSNDAFGPFELMQRLTGHENLLFGMALDPDWVKDMVMTYTEFNIRHWEVLFKQEGLPHSTWIADDLGFKEKPFMSPAMFEDIMLPGYIRLFDYLHGKGLKIILHSCGYIEPFLPMLIDAGLDCLEGIEYKAGMDMPSLFKKFGNNLVYFGNMDIRSLESNDTGLIEKEIREKVLPVIRNGGRYMFHSDHSISPKVEYDTFRSYLDFARSLS